MAVKDRLKRIIEFIKNLTGDNVSVYAAQASFFLVISAIPFLILVFAVMKLFIDVDVSTVLHFINGFLPAQISGFLTDIINELFGKTTSIPVISVTAVSTLWLASRGIMALHTGLDNVYHSEAENSFYNYIRKRFTSVFHTLAFIAAIVLTMVFFGFSGRVEHFINEHFAFLSVILNTFLKMKIIIFLIYLTLVFALFYTFLPKGINNFKKQLPGAVFSATCWMAFSYIYSIYIENFSNYSYVYGSLAAVVLLMLWVYFCMNILLYGAQINKMWENGFFKK